MTLRETKLKRKRHRRENDTEDIIKLKGKLQEKTKLNKKLYSRKIENENKVRLSKKMKLKKI